MGHTRMGRAALLCGVAMVEALWLTSCQPLDQLSDEATPEEYTACGPTENWEPGWEALEYEVIEEINQVRAQGADCHSKGVFEPAGPVVLNVEIRCAARNHSLDMAQEDYFAHTNPAGEQPWDRMKAEGYSYTAAGENIAAGFPSASEAVEGWLESDGHCANLMNPAYVDTGVGFYQSEDSTYVYYWTQDFGTPVSP